MRLLHPWDFPGKSTGVGCHRLLNHSATAAAAKSLQSCLTLCDPMDCSPPGSSVLGIPQARILGWGAISYSRGSCRPRDQTWVSYIINGGLKHWKTLNVIFCSLILQLKVKSEREVAQSCPTLSDPMDCSLPGSSVHLDFSIVHRYPMGT